MVKRVWVDSGRARVGALVVLAGLGLLLSTVFLRDSADDPNCVSIVSPDRASECVAESAQALDRQRLSSMFAIVVAVSLMAVGGVLVARTRRRVLDIAEAADVVETDVRGIRSLIAKGELVSITADGRTYVDVAEVERLRRAVRAPKGMASSGPALTRLDVGAPPE
jgi:hypothetical protein